MFTLSSYSNDFPTIQSKLIDCQQKSTSSDTDSSSNNPSSLIPIDQSPETHLTFSPLSSPPQPDTNPNNTKIGKKQKEELCKTYSLYGTCSYGSKCTFAHGSHELKQNKGPNKKYKTRLCNNFHKEGYCQYGNRCNYIHYQIKEEKQVDNIKAIFVENYDVIREHKIVFRKQSRILEIIMAENQK